MAVKEIRRAAVLGAGVMGSTIAAHLANVGLPVYLLDIVPRELTPDEEKAGLTLSSPGVRNRLATAGKEALLKQKPDPLYSKSLAGLITVGNLSDHLPLLADCGWIVEVVVENMEIKQKLYQSLEQYRAPGTIVSSNTSGLSINQMVAGNSLEFRRHFLGTHFFNPPRYMKLLEIIPCRDTLPEVLDFMHYFCEQVLGKGVVFAKDTPNFIANRIGTYALIQTIRLMEQLEMSIEEVDAITGPPMGHPKSASFRTLDMVGLDTFMHVARTVYEQAASAEEKEAFTTPGFIQAMVDQKMLGDKTGGGFYKKVKGAEGSEILALDYRQMEYRPRKKAKFPIFSRTRELPLPEGYSTLVSSDDPAGQFAREITKKTLLYAASRIPEIAGDVVNVDRAMKWGFNWKLGPFETWDAIGVRQSVEQMKAEGETIPAPVKQMLDSGAETFYDQDPDGSLSYFDFASGSYRPVPVNHKIISLPALKKQQRLVKGNEHGSLIDLGDGVLCLEMHTMRQAISPEFTAFIHEALEEAEQNYLGMVIGNQESNFCVGANLFLVLMAAQSEEWSQLERAVKDFQDALMAIKYSRIPVVAAPFQMTLGGGMELCLHCDRIHAAAETYMGQVEVGVGLLPGGGGNKELLIRCLEGIPEGVNVDTLPFVQKAFEAIARGTVATSAHQARELGFLRPADKITINQDLLIHDAKQTVLSMAGDYQPPRPVPIRVAGEYGLAALKTAVQNLYWGGFISEHDQKIAGEIAFVITGGNITPNSPVSEQYLLDIEREAFLRLCGEEKSLDRIRHMLTVGKPLRN